MNKINLVLSENPSFKFVAVRFNVTDQKTYVYKTFFDLEAEDLVLVNSPSSGLKVVEVVEVCIEEPSFECKWIVQKVDLTSYKQAKALAKTIGEYIRSSEKKKLRKELKESMVEDLGQDVVEGLKFLATGEK